jgi:YD repeat-containing protein
VLADAFSAIAAKSLTVDGQAVALDERGRATFTPVAPGLVRLVATATDVDGFTRQVERILKVRDPADAAAPAVSLDGGLEGMAVAAPIAVRGAVLDGNLESWKLEVALAGSEQFFTIAQGTQAFDAGVIAQLEPATLANGFYVLRLSATDVAGRSAEAQARIEIRSAAKAGGYTREATDFVDSLNGHELRFVRRYDSLATAARGSLGPGWQLALRDVDLASDVPLTGNEAFGNYAPLREGSRVVLTAPTGERIGFTFAPQRHSEANTAYYTPRWVADAGSGWQLESLQAKLQRAGGRFYDLQNGRPYNPGGAAGERAQYTLSAPDGTRYEIAAARGITAIEFADGVRLTVTDSGIAAADGSAIRFSYDAAGRLVRAGTTDGRLFTYEYDESGDLAAVRDLASAASERYAYDAQHRMILATGSGGSVISYGDAAQVAPLDADLGAALGYLAHAHAGALAAGETERLSFAVRESEIRATAGGAVLLGVVVQGEAGLVPALPGIAGLTPVASGVDGTRAFALYRIDSAGLKVLEIRAQEAAAAGGYELSLFVAGDANADGRVDGTDAQLGADANLDGRIDAADRQILFANLGYAPNLAPTIAAGTLRTHADLELLASLASLLSDPEGDPISLRVVDAQGGEARIVGDGTALSFMPSADFTGTGLVRLVADDGWSSSGETPITVDVSDAPLQRLTLSTQRPRLDLGQSLEISVVGDFADQAGVLLPASYLSFASETEAVATIGDTGRLVGAGRGASLISVSRGELSTVTMALVGDLMSATSAEEQALLVTDITGITVYPEAITLQAGGTRQFLVSLTPDFETPTQLASRFFVDNPAVASVSAGGLLTGLAEGDAILTIINGLAEVHVPVKVAAPVASGSSIGTAGGVVQGADGSLVALGAGALKTATAVSITALTEAELPLPVPRGFEFGRAFHLDVGGQALGVPAQIAVPVDPSVAPGTKVYFMRKGDLPDGAGGMQSYWIQSEVGVVGEDGFARTSSPPYTGAVDGGDYAVLFEDQSGSVTLLKGKLNVNVNLPMAFFGIIDPFGGVAQVMNGPFIPFFSTTIDVSRLTLLAVPEVGLPILSPLSGVRLEPGKINSFEATINIPAPSAGADPSSAPVLESARLEFRTFPLPDGTTEKAPAVVLTGRFTAQNGGDPSNTGGQISDLKVEFVVGGRAYAGSIDLAQSSASGGSETLVVRPPASVPIGGAQIRVVRPMNANTAAPGSSVLVPVPVSLPSNSIALEFDAAYVLATSAVRDEIVVLDQSLTPELGQDPLVARIPVGEAGVGDSPRDIAVTPDFSRTYVSLRYSGRVAVVDTLALQELDARADDPAVPETIGKNYIDLGPGAMPYWLAIDPLGEYLYVSDNLAPLIHVVDIRPGSDTYHQKVKNILVDQAPEGLREMAFDSDGRRLYVTAPNRAFAARIGSMPDSQIYVISTDRAEAQFQTQIGRVTKSTGETEWGEANGISKTHRPDRMIFSNRATDSTGFGVIQVDNDSPTGFQATGKTIGAHLGTHNDYFDVNSIQSVTITADGSYAFVTSFNKFIQGTPSNDPNFGGIPGGSNIGIIRDPLGTPTLVGATRPIPEAFADNLVLSADGRYLYAAYAMTNAVFVFDVNAMIAAVENPAFASELATTPIDELDPSIDTRALYTILPGADLPRGRFTFGVPEGALNGPIGVVFPKGLTAIGTVLGLDSPGGVISDLTPEFTWSFEIDPSRIRATSLFVSVYGPGEGLFPKDRWADIANLEKDGSPYLTDLGLTKAQQIDLLSDPWQKPGLSGPAPEFINDFNPHRILTKTFDHPQTTSYTLEDAQRLTMGQTYYWGVEAVDDKGNRHYKSGQFRTRPEPVQGATTFSSVTILTHGLQFEELKAELGASATRGITGELLEPADDLAQAGGGGVVLTYDRNTGRWIAVDRLGRTRADIDTSQSYAALDQFYGKPLVLIPDWSFDSIIPDAGFTEAAADAFFASLVDLDQALGGGTVSQSGVVTLKQGNLLSSPLHFVGASRGTVVISEMIQRVLTYYPEAGGAIGSGQRDLQMTTLDPHDFRQPGLSLGPLYDGSDFLEPHVQAWDGVTFMDTYFQTAVDGSSSVVGQLSPFSPAQSLFEALTPGGRDLPLRPDPEDSLLANLGLTDYPPGLLFPTQGWRTNPLPSAPLLGAPDYRGWLGTSQGWDARYDTGNGSDALWSQSRAGFTEVRAVSSHRDGIYYYFGTANLGLREFGPLTPNDTTVFFRRAADILYSRKDATDADKKHAGYLQEEFYNLFHTVNPWYTTDPGGLGTWEGTGMGFFWTQLGGGSDERPEPQPQPGTVSARVPVDWDNTYEASFRGDYIVPTVFNGNFDTVVRAGDDVQTVDGGTHDGDARRLLTLEKDSLRAVPGWSMHNGPGAADLSTKDLVWVADGDYAIKLSDSGTGTKSIWHNRLLVPEWGVLRADVHVRNPGTGTLTAWIQDADDATPVQLALTPYFTDPLNANQSVPVTFTSVDLSAGVDANELAYGTTGFETFLWRVPDEYRGRVARIGFQVDGNEVLLDDIFFKTEQLVLGNPSEARDDLAFHRDNLLVEKPQFTIGYDESLLNPDWVAWELDAEWLGSVSEDRSFRGDPDLEASVAEPLSSYYLNSKYNQGHVAGRADFNRSLKDLWSADVMTNMLPMKGGVNSGPW